MCGLLAVKIVGSLENAGIDPATSRMLSERSTIWANSPCAAGRLRSELAWPFHIGIWPDAMKQVTTMQLV